MLTALVLSLSLSGGVFDPQFIRGDAQGDGDLDSADAYMIFDKVFVGTPLPCDDAGDANDSGAITSADGYYVLAAAYQGGPAPPDPFPSCGDDPTGDSLGCADEPPGC